MSRPSPHTDIVYQAIVDLSNECGVAEREAIKKRTGLHYSLIDEAVKRLREDEGNVLRKKPGHFVPVAKYAEQAISATVLDDGHVKVECGNDLMTLTPRGCAALMGLLTGYALMRE